MFNRTHMYMSFSCAQLPLVSPTLSYYRPLSITFYLSRYFRKTITFTVTLPLQHVLFSFKHSLLKVQGRQWLMTLLIICPYCQTHIKLTMGLYIWINNWSLSYPKKRENCVHLWFSLPSTTSPGRTFSAFWEITVCPMWFPSELLCYLLPSFGQGNWSRGGIDPSWTSHTLTLAIGNWFKVASLAIIWP